MTSLLFLFYLSLLFRAFAEDVDTPVCDESSEWGGVATSWWKFAVDEYGWDVDPDSIEIVEAAWYPHRYNVFMRKNVESKSNKIDKNLSRDDGPITTCPSHYWNEEMHVKNAFEYDVDLEVVSRIWTEYEKDVRPHLNTGNSTDDFCLVTPYNPETVTWEHDDGVVRSDIKVCDFPSIDWFLSLPHFFGSQLVELTNRYFPFVLVPFHTVVLNEKREDIQ